MPSERHGHENPPQGVEIRDQRKDCASRFRQHLLRHLDTIPQKDRLEGPPENPEVVSDRLLVQKCRQHFDIRPLVGVQFNRIPGHQEDLPSSAVRTVVAVLST